MNAEAAISHATHRAQTTGEPVWVISLKGELMTTQDPRVLAKATLIETIYPIPKEERPNAY